MKFSELDKDKTSKSEEKVLKYWKENDIFKKSIKNREVIRIMSFMMDQYMLMQNLVFIMYLQKLLKMLFVSIKLCKDIEY